MHPHFFGTFARLAAGVLMFLITNKETTMNRSITLGLAMLAGGAIGATAVSALQTQGKAPAAYAVVDISPITNADVFKSVVAKAGPAMQDSGGHFIARTDKITV